MCRIKCDPIKSKVCPLNLWAIKIKTINLSKERQYFSEISVENYIHENIKIRELFKSATE